MFPVLLVNDLNTGRNDKQRSLNQWLKLLLGGNVEDTFQALGRRL